MTDRRNPTAIRNTATEKLSRRTVLRSALGASAVALFGSTPATARQEKCDSFAKATLSDGEFHLYNNDWGSADVDMCIWTDEATGQYGYEWSERTTGGPPNYPEVLLGTKPWGSDTGVDAFPVRRGNVDEFDLAVDVEMDISGGDWDLAAEWWLLEQPVSEQTQTHTHEVMMVLDWGDQHGHYMEEENVWTDAYGNTVDYWANYDGGGTSAQFHIFRVQGGMTEGRVDLTEIIDFLSDRHGISEDLWISGLELGNEYWQGTAGEVTYRQYDVTINGRTYTSIDGADSGSGDTGDGGNSGGGGDEGSNDGGDDGDENNGGDDGDDSDDDEEDRSDDETDAPIATLSPSATTVDVGERVEFDVNDTSGRALWITGLSWAFGDGTTGSGWWNAHQYDEAGTYTVTLTATANTGVETSDEVTITVTGEDDESDGSGGSDDEGSNDHSGSDGDDESSDSDDGESDTDDGDGHIATLSPSTTSADVDERITFSVDDTSGSDRWITDLSWAFGDGTTGSGWWNSHQYDEAGTYTVALTATANTGEQTTHEVTITVS